MTEIPPPRRVPSPPPPIAAGALPDPAPDPAPGPAPGPGPAPAAGPQPGPAAPGTESVLVLGAGIAGLAAADLLSRRGLAVTVLEASARCGGTHRSRRIGSYSFDVGSIFYEEAARLFDLAPGLREACPQVRRVQRRICPDGALLHYPIEPRDLLRWPRPRQLRALADLLRCRALMRRDGTLETACLARLGPTIFRDTGLQSYITRFHHVPPAEIDEEFFFRRMGFIERATRPGALARAAWRALRRKPFRRGPPQPLRVRPAAGFEPLFDAVRATLEARGVRFAMSETLQRLSGGPGDFTVTTSAGSHRAAAVVSTVPLETLHQALWGRGSGLRSLDMLTLFVSAGRLAPETGTVLFNFHGEGRWKRATIYSRIYPEQAGDGRAFFAAEVTLPPGHPPDPEAAFADLRGHLERLDIAGDLRLEGHELVSDCYPLYAPGHAGRIEALLARLAATGVVLAGRQGRFEYLPTSSGVIRRVAEELAAGGLTGPPPERAVPVAPAA